MAHPNGTALVTSLKWGPAVKGLRMACFVDTPSRQPAAQMIIGVAIENVSDQEEIILVEVRPYLSYEVSVRGPGGEVVPMSALGTDIFAGDVFRELASRQAVSIRRERPYVLSFPIYKFFEIKAPGSYEVDLARPAWSEEGSVLRAPVLRFELK